LTAFPEDLFNVKYFVARRCFLMIGMGVNKLNTQKILSYLSALEKNNNRNWFHENRQLHNPKELTFKLAWNTRFSSDTSPYIIQASERILPHKENSSSLWGITIHFSWQPYFFRRWTFRIHVCRSYNNGEKLHRGTWRRIYGNYIRKDFYNCSLPLPRSLYS
jgi:hypothetical protein